MKRIIKYISAAVLGLGIIVSCTAKFEELNTSDITVNPSDLPFSAQCLEPLSYCYAPQQNMFQFWMNLSMDNYCGYFMTPNGNFTNGDFGENRSHSGGMHENYYLHIFNNTRRLISECEAEGKPAVAAVLRVVQALGTIMTTDTYGPIVYSAMFEESISGTNYPYDLQQDIYKAVFDDLDLAIEDLGKATDTEKADISAFDIWVYTKAGAGKGDIDKWIKTANTLRLRMALRLSKRVEEMTSAGYDLKAIAADAAKNTLANDGGDLMITGLYNELNRMFEWGDTGANAFLITLLDGYNDPRLEVYFKKTASDIYYANYSMEQKKDDDGNVTETIYYYTDPASGTKKEVTKEEAIAIPKEDGGYYGIRIGSGLPGKPNNWGSFSQWAGDSSTPLPIFKEAESYFLLAEALLRGWITTAETGGKDIKTLYEEGIRVSIANEIARYGSTLKPDVDAYIQGETVQKDFIDPITVNLDEKDRNDCKATVDYPVKWQGGDDAMQLKQILTQKYIALFPLSYEAWAEVRRTDIPKLFEARVNKSPANDEIYTDEGVRRQVYSDNVGSTNYGQLSDAEEKLNKENTSSRSKGDRGATRVWWDVEGEDAI